MLAIRKFKVCIDVKNGEFICPNPTIVLKKHKELLQNCEIKNGCIEFSILQEDEEKLKGICIPYTVICDDCGQCPTKDGEICFCDSNDDCDSCSNCIGGICQPKCPKECVNGNCVDCTEGNCPTNQECLDGKCQCPPNKPYKDANGVCYGCQDDTQCPPCFRCDGSGNCVPRDCGTGQCDPLLDKCVECVSSDACIGKNKCCVNNKCQCCPGFQLDPITGVCEPKPPCERKEDCSQCEDCVNKKCQPIICPDGFKCEGDDCVPNPCPPTPCKDGTDCGDKCGCDKVCTECAKLSCADCDKALGCVCNPLTLVCEKVKDCDNPCVSKLDCDPNCGCDESTCKDCANYTCEECGNVTGCKCVNKKCVGDGSPRGEDGCKDTFEVIKNPVCNEPKLIATLKKDVSCNCDPINFTINAPKEGDYSFSVLPQKVTGSTLTQYSKEGSPLTSDLEYKVASIYKIKISGTYTEEVDGVQSIKSFSTEEVNKQVTDFRSSFTLDSVFTLKLSNFLKLNTATIVITHGSTLFDENKCKYDNKVIFSDNSIANFSYNDQQGKITYKVIEPKIEDTKVTSKNKRNPLFVWYEDLNLIVKREFVNGTTTFISELLPDLYKTKKSYKVTNDCSCNKEAYYIWDCEKEKYFETANIDFNILQCGKLFKLNSVNLPCNPLHLKEVYKLYINDTFIVDVINKGVAATPFTQRFEEGIKSVYIRVEGTTCEKDYPVEDQEILQPSIKEDCNITNGSTTFTINEDVPNSTIKIVKVTYGTVDSTTNLATKTGNSFIITTLDALKIQITYSNDCPDEIDLPLGKNCCSNCEPSLSESEILFTAAGQKGQVQINNGTCNFSGVKYTSDNPSVKISNSGLVDYETPNNNLDVKITVEYTSNCKKDLTLKFTKSSLNLSVSPSSGCENPTLTLSAVGQVQEGIAYEVRSSCDSSFKWIGVYSSTVSNTPSQNFGLCNYYIYSIGNVVFKSFTNVSYDKINVNTTSFNVNQVVDDCSDIVKFTITPDSSSLEGFKAIYKIDGGASQEVSILREDNKNVIYFNRNILIDNSNCSIKQLAFENFIKGVCVINYSQLVPVNLKCNVNFEIYQKCINGLKSIVVKGPSQINKYEAKYTFNNGSVSTANVNIVTGVPNEYSVTYLSDEIKSVEITPKPTTNNIQYCSKIYQLQPLSCTKKSRNVLGFLAGCLEDGILNLLDSATNKITVKDVIDTSLAGVVSTNPNVPLKYNIFVSNPASVNSPQIIGNLVNGDILFTIPSIPNWNPNAKITLNIAEDSEYLPFSAQFNIVNNSVGSLNWSSYLVLTSIGNYNLEIGGTIQLPPSNPTFIVENLVENTSSEVCVIYRNGPTIISKDCKTLVVLGQVLPGQTFQMPLDTTSIEISRTLNGCPSSITMDVGFVEPNVQVGVYQICNGSSLIYMINNNYPSTIKYNSNCYTLTGYEDLFDQVLIDPTELQDSSPNFMCNQSMCQNSNNLFRYVSGCGEGPLAPDVFFFKDGTEPPSSLFFNNACYQLAGEVQGLSGNYFSSLSPKDKYTDCTKCLLKNIDLPTGNCGEWDEISETWTQGFCDPNEYPFANCQPSPPYYICQ